MVMLARFIRKMLEVLRGGDASRGWRCIGLLVRNIGITYGRRWRPAALLHVHFLILRLEPLRITRKSVRGGIVSARRELGLIIDVRRSVFGILNRVGGGRLLGGCGCEVVVMLTSSW